jgi:hypothetical protein
MSFLQQVEGLMVKLCLKENVHESLGYRQGHEFIGKISPIGE